MRRYKLHHYAKLSIVLLMLGGTCAAQLPEIALRLGKAIAQCFRDTQDGDTILIGKDTRLSGYMLETALTAGICSMGLDVELVGPKTAE